MKKLILISLLWCVSLSGFATTYYVHPEKGMKGNSGESMDKPLKSLFAVGKLNLKPGDQVLLANGYTFKGSLWLQDLGGTSKKRILISNYVSPEKDVKQLPLIDAKGAKQGIFLGDCSYITISNIRIKANGGKMVEGKSPMRCGVLVKSNTSGKYSGIELVNLTITDVFLMEKGHQRGKKEAFTPNGTQGYGWGIRVLNTTQGSIMEDLVIKDCKIQNVAHTGIKVNGKKNTIKNLVIANNKVTKTGGPGIQMSGVLDGHIHHNLVNFSGDKGDTRKWGRGSGLWTWGCDRVLIEHNQFRNAKGPADSAGCHIDFNCSNVIVQYNISENNAGGFCEILGNNYNCAYRYNVSINDGYRVKKKGVASQEGKIFWLSGFNGKDKKHKGPYNSYFYNNTIYVKEGITPKIAVNRAAKGVLIANNIFCFEEAGKQVLGDQYKPEVEGEVLVENIVFKNNLYLKAENWPVETPVQDESPIIGNPRFKNIGGKTLKDFVPQNRNLVKGKAIKIKAIPKDKKGLYLGFEMEKDILGRPIEGPSDLGAIQLPNKAN
ncbi:right-handed parallel beta-helix repeat-containing protein [Flammeovirga sp. MY04]|uniref:right-handed parallel beta-helix repeat-containing protein n=1 Tax=Flammeovirga sp. MY04 TaxID=1191459 RepID=UPI00080612A3|nr:right-handed parallel beta-helix repeat-containing protein [Flammeovirga sp. MY04]ANQ52468.1 right-handed parallel beta-helix repeat-containing protein [Flammeovirga sp. MY04]